MDTVAIRRITIIGGGVVGAIVGAWHIGQDNLMLPTLASVAIVLWITSTLVGVRPDALIGGTVIVGYLVGNRGFAQLHPPGLPLLPGEAALGLGLAFACWHSAIARTLPFRRDALNFFVLTWIVLGSSRILIDFRDYGFMAVRDFAVIYYALFFFLAQEWAERPAERRWLHGCLTLGLALSAPVFCAFLLQPDWFLSQLTVAGIPLIFVKSDVAGGFMAAAVFWFAHRYLCTRRMAGLVFAGAAFFGLAISNSRAAVVALFAGIVWLVVLRLWPLLRVISVLFACGLAALGVEALASNQSFNTSRLYRIYESAASIADLSGGRIYHAIDLDDKPDNNQFRLVWWRTVVEETWGEGRWLGLGFGRDLAVEFLRVYYADANEEFSARSPHNFLLTVFGRMGILGLGGMIAILVVAVASTWRSGQDRRRALRSDSSLPFWLAIWTIMTSACFGVVLEGPMGAIVFWTLLGFANATSQAPDALRKPEPPQSLGRPRPAPAETAV